MPLEDFNDRLSENAPGSFYVTGQCTDCDLCRETAPTVFARLDEMGYSFVRKQPETSEEAEQAAEAMEGCPCEAIFSDGDQFDWNSPREPRFDLKPVSEPGKCSHCEDKRAAKPWWKFW